MTFNRWCLAGIGTCAVVSLLGFAGGKWLDWQTAREWSAKWD
jgi:hypothetical protein